MFDKVDMNESFVDSELKVEKFWKENSIFKKSIDLRKEADVFTFYDGPPTANGKPHIGHVITRAIKDLVPRHRTMKGYKVLRKAGWDTHGLPVELEVEKRLGISGKPEIEKYGVPEFISECKKSVWHYENEWRVMSDRVAFWLDMDDPYVTYHNNYIESEWWALKTIWDKGLIYKGHKVVPYCPRCGTSLSSHEVAQGYKDVTDTTVTAKFKIKDTKNVYILAWTTTPWTLPSNTALATNANVDYVKVYNKEVDEYYILAKALVDTVAPFEIVEEFTGKDLKGICYEPLFDFIKNTEQKPHIVVNDNYVTIADGTGVVHIAPAFGEDDFRLGKENNLPFTQLVNEEGKFTNETDFLAGIFIKDADDIVIKYLEDKNLLYKKDKYEHNYPFCWRCDTPLMYYARDTWFIKMTEMRDKLVANNRTVNWLPENIKEGRFGNFLENVIDWSLSRERYWGTPLPIWECDCGHRHMIGSIEELKILGDNVPDDIELHKPYVDKILITCPKCSKKMSRISEVIDCWFDSGAMPFAQFHYPFENKKLFEENFPADFISEAVDQTRGWFYTLMAIGTLLFDKSPYENVIVMGHILDKNGKKMSKHLGNVIPPSDVLDKQGADAVRWYFYSASLPWLPSRFYEEAVEETMRKFMGTLKNSYSFFVLYANIDNFNPMDYKLEYDKLNIMDKWILSKLNTLVSYVDKSLNEYKITEPTRAMTDFIDELSNWYIRRSRERFWMSDMPQEKINAYMTLYKVLTTFIKLAAPFIPFMTEAMYQNLVAKIDTNAPESVHLCDYPICDITDKSLEENMNVVLKLTTLGRSARNEANIKNRQPLSKLFFNLDVKLDDEYLNIIKEELNVKQILYVEDTSKFSTYSFKPQLKVLGPKYGKLVSKIGDYLKTVDGNEFFAKLQNKENKDGTTFMIEGTEVTLTLDDVLYEIIKAGEYFIASDRGVTVALLTTLTEELIEEGFVREIISKIQTMRKESDFEVMDEIFVYYTDNAKLDLVIKNNLALIKKEVLAKDISNSKGEGLTKEWDVNGEKIAFTLTKSK